MLNAPAFRFQWSWPAAAVAVLAVVSFTPPLSRAVPIQNHPDWPVAAVVDWIEAHGVEGRIFATPDDGAYLTWRLPGRVRCYADTRGFFFPPVVLEDCQYLPQLTPDWPDRLQRVRSYGADYFLLKTTGPHGVLWKAIEPHVAAPLYRDAAVVLRAQIRSPTAWPLMSRSRPRTLDGRQGQWDHRKRFPLPHG